MPAAKSPKRTGAKDKAANQARFLAAYEKCGNIRDACRIAKLGRRTPYLWRENDPAFAEAFEEAHKQACEALESEARRRAVTGTLKPVFHKGEQCGSIREYSDTLLIFLMKGAMPEKYRENVHMSGGLNLTFSEHELEEQEKRLGLTAPRFVLPHVDRTTN